MITVFNDELHLVQRITHITVTFAHYIKRHLRVLGGNSHIIVH